MATNLVIFKILFLVLIAHRSSSFRLLLAQARLVQIGGTSAGQEDQWKPPQTPQAPSEPVETAAVVDVESISAPPAPEQQVATSEGILPVSSPTPPRAGEPSVNYAELCYLSNGGSSLTLTVNEATQIGAVIGTIDVNGDPTLDGGNVELSELPSQQDQLVAASIQAAELRSSPSSIKQRRLPRVAPHSSPPPLPQSGDFYAILSAANGFAMNQQQQTNQQQQAIRLEPGTKNLILVRSLDKESVEGEQSLLIQVRCRPREHPNEATTIPVRILITDANDNAPEFVGQLPYVINVSETSPIGSIATRDLLAIDKDSAGPHSTLHYRVLEDGTPQAHLLKFTNPLEPTLYVNGQLDYETAPSFTLTIVASDQGEPEAQSSMAQLQVNVVDFDDQNPKFMEDKYTLVMDESQQSLVGQTLQVLPRNLHAEDGDRGIDAKILYSFDKLGGEPAETSKRSDEPADDIDRYLHLNPNTGEIRLIRQWPAAWSDRSPVTLVVRATQADNKDRYTLTTLTITSKAGPSARQSGGGDAASNKSLGGQQQQHGIEFAPDKLTVNLLESVPINEKIVRVKAKFLGKPPANLRENLREQQDDGLSQAVDLITGTQRQLGGANRPIGYQILDDQTDQFGITGLGEIYVKKALDYELKREFKFRVLATYAKYSDICQVQVNVLNVNDNKPKFTQNQYTFHLTESRLRSNLIGSIQAHDADGSNDTIRYSLLGEHAQLFDLNPSTGQLTLRSEIKQLNLTCSQCQLTAQATDSLPPQSHTQQARINLHIAPQLIGRSLTFAAETAASTTSATILEQPPASNSETRLLNTRNLLATEQQTGAQRDDWPISPNGRNRHLSGGSYHHPQQPLASNQRSSVATILSSLQHMARSVNLLEMPMSSAPLLFALLAFLVCLLFIVMISIGVHSYRRHTKLRRRRHLTAAAQLRNAQLAARLRVSASTSSGASDGLLSPGADNTNGIRGQISPKSHLSDDNHQRQQPDSPATHSTRGNTSTSSSHNSTPTGNINQQTNIRSSQAVNLKPKLTAKVAPAVNTSASYLRPGSRQSIHSGQQLTSRSQAGSLSAQLCSTMHQTSRRGPHSSPSPLLLQRASGSQATPRQSLGGGTSSLLSSLSSQSKRSYASNSTDESSVMHCGHYSVQGASCKLSPSIAAKETEQPASGCSPVEAAIRCLVQGPSVSNISQEVKKLLRQDDCSGANHLVSPRTKRKRPATTGELSSAGRSGKYGDLRQSQREIGTPMSSKPGIKSHRQVPLLLGSSVRPLRPLNRVAAVDGSPEHLRDDCVNNDNGYTNGTTPIHDSAIGSDASSSGKSNSQLMASKSQNSQSGLMAMIREPNQAENRSSEAIANSINQQQQQISANAATGNIRWPHEMIPQRVKKLTWDDELSCSGSVCDQVSSFGAALSPGSQLSDLGPSADLHHLSCATTPLSPVGWQRQRNLYNGQSTATDNRSAIEQHFLYSSSPCSPALMSASDLKTNDVATAADYSGTPRCNPDQQMSSMTTTMGQNNCLDYTIVQSSQFHVDSLAFEGCRASSDMNSNNAGPLIAGTSNYHHRPLPPLSASQVGGNYARNHQYEPSGTSGPLRIQDLDSLTMTTAVL